MATKQFKARNGDKFRFLRRFSSIKVDFEKEKRKTLSRYQEQGLRVSITNSSFLHDKKEIRKRLRVSVERYSLPELYVKMICALFPAMKSRETLDSNALIRHLKHVFRLNDQEHAQLMEIARMTKLPQRIINLEIVEAKNIPPKDANGLSDPFCVVYLNSRDIAQRTKVVENTLNPKWKQYFTFKVNDPQRDILCVEIMDYNKDEEPLRDKLKKIKDIKSPGTLKIVLREIANARSVQELIGSLRIPVSEISSETLERWFKLKNHEDRGEIYLRMALGYNKSKETATDEFLQILHFLLAYELEKEASLGTPFYWDEHYEMWSKYILCQFKWQGGLKPKDIVLSKWRAYTLVNSIFPLNANMVCLLMDAVLERALNCEYDTREISRFWDSTVLLVNTIITFLTEIHDVLPCPVTVLHTYHMLKTLELLCQFLSQPTSCDRGKVPYTKAAIIDLVVKAVRDGAEKFYVKVFSDSTHDAISPDGDPLLVALERLLGMGQILHEDLRLGLNTIHTDFNGILNVDYMEITFRIYDEKFGKMVKYIIEEYNSKLLDPSDSESDMDESLEENSSSVKAGLTVLKLYLCVKNFTELAPQNYLEGNNLEYSLKKGFHQWFFHSVATWIDILRKRIIKWVKNSVNISEGNSCFTSECSTDSKLSKTDKQDTREVPISPSAVDTAQMFLEIHKFWMSLGWEDPHQSYLIIRKILEELYGFLIYYGAELLETLKGNVASIENLLELDNVHAYLYKACTSINNINYVKEQVETIGSQLNINGIIRKIVGTKRSSDPGEDYEEKIAVLKTEMQAQVESVIADIMKCCKKAVSPKCKQSLLEVYKEATSQSKRASRNRVAAVIDYIDNCLIIMNINLERGNFQGALTSLWTSIVEVINELVEDGLEAGKTQDYFTVYSDLLLQFYHLFWPREVEIATKIEDPSTFEAYVELKTRLSFLGMSLEELKLKYYQHRYNREQSTPVKNSEHGLITIRACYVERESSLTVEILNARNLKSYDSNNSSDPYALVNVFPKEIHPSQPTFTTKCHKQTLFPLFEEENELIIFMSMTKSSTLSTEDMKRSGFLAITLYDYDFLGRDDLMGEAFFPLSDVKRVDTVHQLESQAQIHLPFTKPDANEDEMLQKFEDRSWDKEAIKFARQEREKIE